MVLAGGSAFGLAAATGVMDFLEKHQAGMDMGVCHVPIVPGAVIFDLTVGDAHVRPGRGHGYRGMQGRVQGGPAGRVRRGYGATVGKLVPAPRPCRAAWARPASPYPAG